MLEHKLIDAAMETAIIIIIQQWKLLV